MKITKRQLRKIIAEEYTAVYGSRKPAKKSTSRQRKIVEAKKKRAILAEARRNYNQDQVLEEGLGSFLKKLGGMFGKAMKQATTVYGTVQGAWKEVSDNIDLKEDQRKEFEEAIKRDAIELGKEFTTHVQRMPEFKKIADSFSEEDKDKKQKELFAAALSLFKATVALPDPAAAS